MTPPADVTARSRFFSRVLSSRLLRSVAAVAGGTVVGQAVALAFSPLITRIYGPEVLGLQGVFVSLISILGPVVAMRYPMAIVMAEHEEDAGHLVRMTVLIAFILSTGLGLLLLVAPSTLLTLIGGEALGSLIWLLPVGLFCVALQDVANYRAARLSRFRLIGAATVFQSLLANLIRVLGGLVSPVAAVLIAVACIAPAIQAGILALGSRSRCATKLRTKKSVSFALLKKHRDFPLYRMPTDVLNAASQSVPVIMLAALFSPAAAGFYALTRAVLNLPVNVIGVALGDVLYTRYADMARSGKPLTPLLLRSTLVLLATSPIMITGAWLAPDVFAYVFGEEWRESGRYAQWMALWVSAMIVNIPTTRIIPVIGRQKGFLIFNVILLAIRISAVWAAARLSGDPVTAVSWYSIGSTVAIAVCILIFFQGAIMFDRARSLKRA